MHGDNQVDRKRGAGKEGAGMLEYTFSFLSCWFFFLWLSVDKTDHHV